MKTFQDFSPYNGLQWGPNGSRSKWEFQMQLQRALNDTRRWIRILSSETIAHLKNKYKHYKHTCLYEMNEQNDSKKDLLILMNERASQNRARRAFELTKLKLCYLFIKWAIVSLDKTLFHRLELFKALWNSHLDLEPFGPHWSPLYGENPGMFSSKTFDWRKKDMDILDE